MSPRLLPYSSAPVTDTARLSPAVSGSDPASTVRWASGPGVTSASIVAVTDPDVAVMWCQPATVALQVWPQHEPSGPKASEAGGPISPRSFPYRSVPCMTTVSEVPARNEPAAISDRCSRAAGTTCIAAVAWKSPLVTVTSCGPAAVEVHAAWSQPPPLTAIDDTAVRSPNWLPKASNPAIVNGCVSPATIDAAGGETASRSSGPAVTTSEIGLAVGPLVVVTVCSPAVVAVHVAPVQEPSGAIANEVDVVTSPAS